MSDSSKKLTVTALQHPDGVVTAFFNELPGLVVQGTRDDVSDKLSSLLKSYIKRLQSIDSNFEIKMATV